MCSNKTTLKRLVRGSDLQSENKRLKFENKALEAENEALKAKLAPFLQKQEEARAFDREMDQWYDGEICLHYGAREPRFITLDEAKDLQDRDPWTMILWRIDDGRWYLDDSRSYFKYHKEEDDFIYGSTDAHDFCQRCGRYDEVDGNGNCYCACCRKIWCLDCWEREGGGDELCRECAAKEEECYRKCMVK